MALLTCNSYSEFGEHNDNLENKMYAESKLQKWYKPAAEDIRGMAELGVKSLHKLIFMNLDTGTWSLCLQLGSSHRLEQMRLEPLQTSLQWWH